VTTSGGTAASTGYFIVLPTEDFQLSVAQTTVSVAASGEAAIQLTLSGSGGYTALTTLGVSGVPPGVSATVAEYGSGSRRRAGADLLWST